MKSKFLVSIVACLSIFQACDNCLDETKYTYSISSETFYNTLEEANAAVLAPLLIILIFSLRWKSIRNTAIRKGFTRLTRLITVL